MKLAAAIAMILLLASCAGTQRDPFAVVPGAPAWPPPPEAPRVQYVTSIQRHNDLFEMGNFFTSLIDLAFGEEDTYMARPYAVAVHPTVGLIVTDPGRECVHFYDSARRKHRVLGRDLEGGLPSPVGVAVATDGSILVSDSRRRTIERFDTNGRHLGTFAGGYTFERPGGIAVHPATGDVYAADIRAHSIVVLTPGGEPKRVLGGNGAEWGMFNFPTHVAIDPEGNLLVADSMNFRIQRLSTGGQPLASYGEPGNARGNFARPKGVAAIDGDIYVAMEGLYDSLVFFNAAGELLLSVGQAGSEPGQFWLPAGIAMDRNRNLLFVADTYNSRVQVFRMVQSGEREVGQ